MNADGGVQFTLPDDIDPTGVDSGTNVMVDGSSSSGARTVALSMVLNGADDDGILLLSADVSGRDLLQRAEEIVDDVDRDRIGVVDCSGIEDDQRRFDEHARSIDHPGDLLSIEMEFSVLYETLVERGYDQIRVGVFSISSLLAHTDLRTVSRFVHMLTGRIIATGDFGVFVLDDAMEDDRTVDAIERYCDGTVDVRETENADGSEFDVRTRGLTDEPSWTSFSPGECDRPWRWS